jgi:hypothetical protein
MDHRQAPAGHPINLSAPESHGRLTSIPRDSGVKPLFCWVSYNSPSTRNFEMLHSHGYFEFLNTLKDHSLPLPVSDEGMIVELQINLEQKPTSF